MNNLGGIKLRERLSAYTFFEQGQVLTPDQLNEITEYLDRQDRLTRVELVGVGLVCGLVVGRPAQQPGVLSVSPGCAVTSDGDLLSYGQEQRFSFFKPFVDQNANYQPFVKSGEQIELFELLPEAADQTESLSDFEELTGRPLTAMAALLYLESYYFDPDICTGGDCDNKGQRFENNLRLLLAPQAALSPLADRLYFGIPELARERALPGAAAAQKLDDLLKPYRNAMVKTLKQLLPALAQGYQSCESLLAGLYEANPVERWRRAFDELMDQIKANPAACQYAYDFLGDIVAAHNEFKEALYQEGGLCLPDIELFPKHVLLGGLSAAQPYDPYRHAFYPSPAHSGFAEVRERLRFLHSRIDRLINSFSLPTSGALKITPSRRQGELGGQAIPYYYRIDTADPLNRHWSWAAERRRLSGSLYGYHAALYSQDERALNPLNFDLSGYSLLRVEGHLGRDFQAVEKELSGLIAAFNLPLELVSLQLEQEGPLPPRRPPFWLDDIGLLHNIVRRDLKTQVEELGRFNLQISDTIKGSAELPQHEITDDQVSKKQVEDGAKLLDGKIKSVGRRLSQPLAEFDHQGFAQDYVEAIKAAALVNNSVKGITFNSAFTPYEKFVNNGRFQQLQWLADLLKDREKQAGERLLFANFLKDNPGLEHLGGVEPGGTLVLVYSAADRRVVADFALPYRYAEQPRQEDKGEGGDGGFVKPDWLDLNDILFNFNKKKLLGAVDLKLAGLDKQLSEKLDFKVTAQSDAFNKAYSGSVSTVVDTIFKRSGQPGIDVSGFGSAGLADAVTALDDLRRYAAKIDDKVKAGTASDFEVKVRKDLDATMASLIKNSLKEIGGGAADIAAGSDEERFLESVAASAAVIKNETVKKRFITDLGGLSESAKEAGKGNLVDKIDVLIR